MNTRRAVIVRCPRCGSTDAESVEAIHIEFDRMRCHACGFEQICDEHQIKLEWNEVVEPAPAGAKPPDPPEPSGTG